MNNPTLTPAYGRDYKSQLEVKSAFYAGKDFIIADFSHPYDGKPMNINDCSAGTVSIRYSKLTKVCSVIV
jgi:hypothetical protein